MKGARDPKKLLETVVNSDCEKLKSAAFALISDANCGLDTPDIEFLFDIVNKVIEFQKPERGEDELQGKN